MNKCSLVTPNNLEGIVKCCNAFIPSKWLDLDDYFHPTCATKIDFYLTHVLRSYYYAIHRSMYSLTYTVVENKVSSSCTVKILFFLILSCLFKKDASYTSSLLKAAFTLWHEIVSSF